MQGGFCAMGDYQKGPILCSCQAHKQSHHLCPGLLIQIPGWLICQDQQRIMHKRGASATRCCSPPESFSGNVSQRSSSPTAREYHALSYEPAVGGDEFNLQRQADIFANRQNGDQVEKLEDKADLCAAEECAVMFR